MHSCPSLVSVLVYSDDKGIEICWGQRVLRDDDGACKFNPSFRASMKATGSMNHMSHNGCVSMLVCGPGFDKVLGFAVYPRSRAVEVHSAVCSENAKVLPPPRVDMDSPTSTPCGYGHAIPEYRTVVGLFLSWFSSEGLGLRLCGLLAGR